VKKTHVTAARPAAAPARMEPAAGRRQLRDAVVLSVALAVLSLVAFYPALDNGFTNLDDDVYVVKNPRVLNGLSGEDVAWAFGTSFHTGNWHPLTWLSLQADASLFGTGPAGFHGTNVLLHACNAVLLFLVLLRMTGRQWPSVVVAALFAVHPLRVESVAWISERKDVLSTFFGLLALLAYAGYAATPSVRRYLLVAAPFALSLLAKPMWVTLPCLLLLLDWWPLGRLRFGKGATAPALPPLRLLLEKLPLFLMTACSCAITWVAQRTEAASSLAQVSFGARVGNALAGYGAYLWQTVWPRGLAPFYPLPTGGPSPEVIAGSAVLLVVITAMAGYRWRVRPYLAVGWLWYLGTLVPVVGLVQVGGQARADRYTYLPLIGIYLMAVWGLDELAARYNARKAALAAAGVVVAVLTVLCSEQASLWHDNVRLWEHTVAVTRDNWMAELSLADAEERAERPDPDAAFVHFAAAAELNPTGDMPQSEFALRLLARGKKDAALSFLRAAIDRVPRGARLRTALGIYYHGERDLEAARKCYEEALRLNPSVPKARANLGAILWSQRDLQGALEQLQFAVKIEPDNGPAFFNLGAVLEDLGHPEEAAAAYRRAVALDRRLEQRLDPTLRRRRQ
jgi:tetratricopeptide (TPR) repeat protein